MGETTPGERGRLFALLVFANDWQCSSVAIIPLNRELPLTSSGCGRFGDKAISGCTFVLVWQG